METALIDWSGILAIAALNIALIGWLRGDQKRFEGKIETLIEKVSDEMKDFHGRLCSIEARYHSEHYIEKGKDRSNE